MTEPVVARPRVLRVVALGSEKGRYGGPYDTALRQAAIVAQWLGAASPDSATPPVTFLAGELDGDEPTIDPVEGLRLRLVPVRPVMPAPGFTGLYSRALGRAIAEEVASADVVHISMARELIPIAALRRAIRAGRSVIVQPHGMLTGRTSVLHRAIDLVVVPLIRRATTVVALTAIEGAELAALLGPGHPPIELLGNPIPPEVTEGATPRHAPAEPADVVFIARLQARKRVTDFVAAAAIAATRGWTERYGVVGPDQGDLSAVLAAVEVTPALSYEGTVPARAVTARVEACDIFVLPALDEPWGNVLVTAIALGKPVVVCRSAALASEIEQYGCGLVVDDGDQDALAGAIHELAIDRALYARCVDGAVRFTGDRLSRAGQRDRLLALYGVTS